MVQDREYNQSTRKIRQDRNAVGIALLPTDPVNKIASSCHNQTMVSIEEGRAYKCAVCGKIKLATELKSDFKIKSRYGGKKQQPFIYGIQGGKRNSNAPDDLGHDPSITWVSDTDVSNL